MSIPFKIAAAVVLCFAIVACATDVVPEDPGVDAGGAIVPREWSDEERLAVELSFLSYAGFWLGDATKTEDAVAEILGRVVPGQEIVWGPVAHQSGSGLLDTATDALLFVCRDRDTGAHNVVLRGTNPVSLMEWIVQDFQVLDRVPWSGIVPGSECAEAFISESTAEALRLRAGLRPSIGRPGDGLSLLEALTLILERDDGGSLFRFTGHSLGGLLAPVMALYLVDSLEAEGRTELLERLDLEVMGFAGPTAGNSDFAEYLAARLSGDGSSACPAPLASSVLARYANDLDIATLVWDQGEMAKMPSLYLPTVKLKGLTRVLYDACLDIAEGGDYAHCGERIPVPSVVIPVKGRIYLLEAAYQHSVPYLDLLRPEREDVILGEIIDPLVSKIGVKGVTPGSLRDLMEEKRESL